MSEADGINERVDAIKLNNPLSSVIGHYIDLKRCGAELRGCCPFHSDRTPSFYVNDKKGQYHCFGCGAGGDVIDFIREYQNMTFCEAIDFLRDGERGAPETITFEANDTNNRSEIARKVWDGCIPIPGTPAAAYLEKRGLPAEWTCLQKDLRFGRGTFDGSTKKHPMLVAAARNWSAEIVGIQRIYIDDEGGKLSKDCKRSLGQLRGAAVKLATEGEQPGDRKHIYLTEGLEDALSLSRIHYDEEVWATLGVGGFMNVDLPAECLEVTIAHDNDDAGRNAANQAAARFIKEGRAVNLMPPPPAFKDWNEYLMFWEFDPPSRFHNELPSKMSQGQLEEFFGFTEESSND